MKKTTTLLKFACLTFIMAFSLNSHAQWNTLVTDAALDGFDPDLLDGTELSYQYNSVSDSLWFRISINAMTTTQSNNLGVNIMVNYSGGGNTFNFWGFDNTNPFHKLVTAWVAGTPPSNYTGTVGISDEAGVTANDYTSLFSNNLDINVDMAGNTIIIGMNREDLIPNGVMGQQVLVAAAVGSDQLWNDDLYDAAAFMTLSPSSIVENSVINNIKVGPNPGTGLFSINSANAKGQEIYINVTNTLGQTIIENKLLNSSNRTEILDLSKFENGVYNLTLSTASEVSSKKIILAK